jgi:galactan endo-1,6-beta-galactosidase
MLKTVLPIRVERCFMRRRTFLTAAGTAVVGSALGQLPAHADYSTMVNPGTTWGTWEGWGTSLCWWGKAYGANSTLADIMFTTNTVSYHGTALPGLGLNIVRYNAGACTSNSVNGQSMVSSPNISPTRQMDGYWLDWFSSDPSSSSWNWSADANQRNLLLAARDRGANIFELFSNSPMWWMCDNHNPSGNAVGSQDNLQTWNQQQHAIYLATIAKYAHDHWGFDFHAVEAFNEPSSAWWTAVGTQEGCHLGAATQASVIPFLRSELNSRGLTGAVVAASDENTYDIAVSTWQSFSSTTRADVGKINVHGYQYGGGRRDLLYTAAHTAGKVLWNSEYGESDASGLSLASNLNLDLRWLHPTAWVYWQVLDGGGWGLIQADESAGTTGAVNTKFYVLAQYTRHIRQGMRIIDSGEANTTAAYDNANKRLILVTTNYGTAQRITYDLSKFSSVGGGTNGLVDRWATQTNGTGDTYTHHTDTHLSGRTFVATFPTNTVQTFSIDNVVV